jgi:hypothetical protein
MFFLCVFVWKIVNSLMWVYVQAKIKSRTRTFTRDYIVFFRALNKTSHGLFRWYSRINGPTDILCWFLSETSLLLFTLNHMPKINVNLLIKTIKGRVYTLQHLQFRIKCMQNATFESNVEFHWIRSNEMRIVFDTCKIRRLNKA